MEFLQNNAQLPWLITSRNRNWRKNLNLEHYLTKQLLDEWTIRADMFRKKYAIKF